uniref:F-box/FBD/LRR-repeat protein At1g80470-like n=1 Tax=Erigeron canadensis TaxID=72917 RepID=UPI001CB98DC9|nr:F-box/FBD/LRR-repeat protein At1g80470-like [Erigeron canadensis]XP_043607437.1 F-box/FBD/LRR-repeat protein At1g80470-like [Erigeron canadensis]
MDFDHENVRLVVNEDRLSSLPDELIHYILSCIDDTKFVIQTCLLLSPRWKLVWKSVPCLNFYSRRFPTVHKFSKFVTNVLSRRNNHVEVSTVKLSYSGAASQAFVKKIANYACSHNVQELVVLSRPKNHYDYPPCLFTSTSLKHFTFSSMLLRADLTPKLPKTPWNFPALTTLNLSDITLCEDNREYFELFSRCVNLKDLALNTVIIEAKVFDIITPRLSSLVLNNFRRQTVINVIAPQLENLSIIDCTINHLDTAPRLSSFVYKGYGPPKWFKGSFSSLNKVSVCLSFHRSNKMYDEEEARETISMLQELKSAKFLTLNFDIVECLSAYPDLLSHVPSPFSNLICLNIDPKMRSDAYKVNVSTEARNFLLENSPSATFIMDIPEEPPTKAMIAKQAREAKRAKLIAEVKNYLKELQAELEQQNMLPAEREVAEEKAKLGVEKLMSEIQEILVRKKLMRSEPGKAMESVEIYVLAARTMAQIVDCMQEILGLIEQAYKNAHVISSKRERVRSLLEAMPKRHKAEMEARYSHQLEETDRFTSKYRYMFTYLQKTLDAFKEVKSDYNSTFPNISSTNLPLASQLSSSSAISMPSPLGPSSIQPTLR